MTTVTKGKIVRSDIAPWDGTTSTITRRDSTGGTITGLKVGNEIDVIQAYGNGVDFTGGAIAKALLAIGSANATLVFAPGTWVISEDLTIGANFACRVPGGAIFSVAAGKTLTFSGPVLHDLDTWYSGSGTVTQNATTTITGKVDLSGATLQGATPLVFEGDTVDSYTTSMVITDPTANRTITFPDADVDLSDFASVVGMGRNMIKNGSYAISQRYGTGATSIADDTYSLDCWYALTQSSTITVSQQVNQENGTPYNIRLKQSYATAQRMGIAQIIESKDCIHARGQDVVLSFRFRYSTNLPIRYAILEWTGTADTVTSDVVNDWTSGTYTAGNFFNSSNITVVAVGTFTNAIDTWGAIPDWSGTISSSAQNLIVVIWTQTAVDQNNTLDIGRVQLELGTAATTFEREAYGDTLRKCRRYLPFFPNQSSTVYLAAGKCRSTTTAAFPLIIDPPPRKQLTDIVYENYVYFFVEKADGTTAACSASLALAGNGAGYVLECTVASGLTAGHGSILTMNDYNYLYFTGAEL